VGSVRALLAALAVAALAAGTGCRLQSSAPAKAVTEQAPSFSLPDHNGQSVSLSALRERGPAILVFYRGHW
jgi:cytochrome oxidase Cu insertion factor (SCO1/SenC/PrrC family)